MEHWRSIKLWITDHLLFWFPFGIPSWLVDYYVIGLVFIRSMFSVAYSGAMQMRMLEMERQPKSLLSNYAFYLFMFFNVLIGIPLFILLLLSMWPWLLLVMIFSLFLDDDAPVPHPYNVIVVSAPKKKDQANGLKMFLFSLLSFIPFLFVVTNELPQIFGPY